MAPHKADGRANSFTDGHSLVQGSRFRGQYKVIPVNKYTLVCGFGLLLFQTLRVGKACALRLRLRSVQAAQPPRVERSLAFGNNPVDRYLLYWESPKMRAGWFTPIP
jgi:hypothetical protein